MRLRVFNKISILFVIPFFLTPAQKKIDSLFNQINSTAANKKAELYAAIGKEFENDKIDSALHYDSLALSFLGNSGNNKLKADIYYRIGFNFYLLGNNSESLNYNEKALAIYTSIDDQKGRANSLNTIGVVYQNFGNYDKALKTQLEALQIYDGLKDLPGTILTYNHLGVLYKNLGDYKKSLDYYNRALEVLKISRDKDLLAQTFNNIANLSLVKNEFREALGYALKSLNIKKEINSGPVALVNSYSTLGTILRDLKQYRAAVEQYNLGLHIADKLGNKNHQSLILKNLGILYSMMGDDQKALLYHKKSMELAQKINFNRIILDDLKNLSDIYKKTSQYQLALKYYRQYTHVRDSIFNQDLKTKLSEYRLNYEAVRKAKALQQLKAEKQKSLSVLITLIALLILVLAAVIYYRYRTKAKMNSSLSEKNKELAGVLEKVNESNKNLSSSESTYRYLFEHNPMPMFIVSQKQLKILAANEAAASIYGYNEKELAAMNFMDLWDEESLGDFDIFLNNFINKPGKVFTVKHRRKEGRVIHTEISSHPLVFEGKDALHVMVNDETERKLIEQVVQESEERFRNLFESAPDAILIGDANTGLIVDANPAASRLMQRPLYDIIGVHQTKFHPPDKYEISKESFERHKLSENKNKPTSVELEIMRPDGERIPVEISARLLSVNGRNTIQGIFRDISLKKKMIKSLEENERRLKKAQKIANVGYWELDLKTNIIFGSEESAEMYGFSTSKNQMDFNDIKAMVYPDDRVKLDNLIKALVTEGKDYDTQYKIRRRDNGETRMLQAKAELIKDENGEPVKVIGALRDVTELYNYQQELIHSREIAEKSDKLKSEFLAQMSHEIRSPVNIILSFTSLIKDELNSELNEDMKSCFTSIDNGGRRLIRTIDLILNTADIQSGKYESYFEELDLETDIFAYLLPDFINRAKKNNLEFKFTTSPGIKKLMLDKYSVTQIFSNLIDNSIKYTKEGGIEVSISENPKGIGVAIKDTGIGISEEFLPYIFDPFSQEEQGYTRRFEGTGLGLALVKKYCDINRCSIKVESTKGTGTTFKIDFPVTTENMFLANYSSM